MPSDVIQYTMVESETPPQLLFDRILRPHVTAFGRKVPIFWLFGSIGFVSALVFVLLLAGHRHLRLTSVLGIVFLAVVVFLGQAYATKVIIGKEQLVYYRHEIATLLAGAFFLKIAGRPVVEYLDVFIIGLGVFLVCGRLGCLMAGCCFGKPHRLGVHYHAAHADCGFPISMVGVPVFPIQLVESVIVSLIVLSSAVQFWKANLPGTALTLYIFAYAVARFLLEFMRGDFARGYWRGLSEAQWTGLGSTLALGWAELSGVLPRHSWHIAVGSCIWVVGLTLVGRRWLRPRLLDRLTSPRHVGEISKALCTLRSQSFFSRSERNPSNRIVVLVTSCGLGLSLAEYEPDSEIRFQVALSLQNGNFDPSSALALGDLVVLLLGGARRYSVILGGWRTYHILVGPGHPSEESPSSCGPVSIHHGHSFATLRIHSPIVDTERQRHPLSLRPNTMSW